MAVRTIGCSAVGVVFSVGVRSHSPSWPSMSMICTW